MKTLRSLWLATSALALGWFTPTSLLHAADNPPPPHVLLLTTDPLATESGTEAGRFLVVRTGPTTQPLAVHYHLGGTAENGVDYVELPGHLTIPAGSSFAPIVVTALEDDLVEGNETVLATLRPQPSPGSLPPYVVTWPFRGVVTILDNDRPVNLPPQVALINPPDGAILPGPADVQLVARAWDRDGRVESVEFFANGESLGTVHNWVRHRTAGLLLESELSVEDLAPVRELFPGLEPAVIALNQDESLEVLPHHGFRLKWEGVPPGDYELMAVATDNDGASTRSEPVKLTILEAPVQPVVTVVARDPVAHEGGVQPDDLAAERLDTATFVIRRTGPTDQPLEVFYSLGGTAENGLDYVELPTVATIPAGARAVEVVVVPIDDALVENTETVILSLEEPACTAIWPPSPDCYLVGRPGRAIAYIRDNDSPPGNLPPRVALVSPADGSIFRGPATITLVADARDRDGRVVSVEFFNGEESLGLVHRPSLELRPLDDGGVLPVLPPFVFTWENVPAGGYVLSAVATDNDGTFTHSAPVEVKVVATQRPPVVTIHTIDGLATEPNPFTDALPDTARFEVRRTGNVEHSLPVFYRIGGTAANGEDYEKLSGVVVIPAGGRAADIEIVPLPDDAVEGDESVILKLLPPDARMLTNIRPSHWPRYVVGEPAMARAVIRDDDEPPPGNQPPRVALLAPLDGSVFRAGADIGLAAAAGDPDGWVQQVEFFANDESLGVVPGTNLGTTAREWFRLKWADVPPGGYELVAVATDNEGASTRSAPIRIRVLDVCARTYVSIAAIDPIASEGPRLDAPLAPALVRPDTATIRISRRACDVSLPLEVRYAIGGTAANSEDYRELSGVAVIPANAWHVDVVIWPIDDELVEGNETVILGLIEPPCPAIEPPPSGCYVIHGSAKAIAYILDNDTADNQLPKLALTQPATGDTLPLPEPVTIVAHTVDPDGWVSKVEFFANGEKIGEEEIVFIQEPPPGQEQRFSLRWTGAPAGKYLLVARATDNRGGQSRSEAVRMAIVDEHPIPKVFVSAVDPVAAEGTPPKTATFAIHRTARNDVPLEVFYQLGGTAENGVDYEHLGGSVIIPAGEWRAPVVVVPIDDDLVEGTETVILELLTVACPAIWPPSPDCYEVGQPGRAIAFIRDNDIQHNRPPRIALTEPVDGDVFTGPLDIKLRAVARDPDGWVSRVIFYDGREPIGEVALDFIQPPPPGERQVFEFLWQDAPVGRHGLTAVAVDDQGARAVSDPVFIQVIPPQGPPVVTIHARDPFARETKPDAPPQTATFRIHRTGPTGTPLTVFYRVGGTATNGEDYEELSGVLIIPAGRASAPIVVRPIDDDLPERVETVLLALVESPQLVTTPSYVIGRPARAAAFILDNDRPRPASVELPDGLVHLRLAARDGVSYALEATENFLDWWPVDHRTAREGVVEFIDPDAPGKVMRFYRLVESVDPLRLEDDLD